MKEDKSHLRIENTNFRMTQIYRKQWNVLNTVIITNLIESSHNKYNMSIDSR
jgi:hypothetical protein